MEQAGNCHWTWKEDAEREKRELIKNGEKNHLIIKKDPYTLDYVVLDTGKKHKKKPSPSKNKAKSNNKKRTRNQTNINQEYDGRDDFHTYGYPDEYWD